MRRRQEGPDGVRRGLRVRDLDGKDLGRVARIYDWGFEVEKGLPLLVREDLVVRYDEVRGVEDGALVVARSDGDLLVLAGGGVPRSWRVRVPPGFPAYATPEEARGVVAELAAARAAARTPGLAGRGARAPVAPDSGLAEDAPAAAGLSREAERRAAETRGQPHA